MLAIRIATNNPEKGHLRPDFIEAHKSHLRSGAINIVMSGPLKTDGNQPGGAVIVAEVEDLSAFARFSAEDPFVREGIYQDVRIVEWAVTIDNRR